MLHIKVLGPGCANCYILQGLAIAAVQIVYHNRRDLFKDGDVSLEHVSDPVDFRKYGLLYSPGLVVNEKLVAAGRLPSVLEIMDMFEEALAAPQETSSAQDE